MRKILLQGQELLWELSGADASADTVSQRLRSSGMDDDLIGRSDPAHALATAVAVGSAMGLGSVRMLTEPVTLAHLLTEAPSVQSWVTPLEALWDEALDHRRAGRLDEYGSTLGQIAGRLIEAGNEQRAESCLVVAEGLAQRLGDRTLTLQVLSARAHLRFWHGDYQDAVRLYRFVLADVPAWLGTPFIARTVLALGDTHFFLKEGSEAEACWREALDLYGREGDLAAQAETLERIAALLFARGEVDGARVESRAAERLWADSGIVGFGGIGGFGGGRGMAGWERLGIWGATTEC